MGKYLCKNYSGSCSKATSKEVLEIGSGMDPLCPECGMTLTDWTDPATPPRKKLIVAGSLAVVVAAAGIGAWNLMERTPDQQVAQPAIATAPHGASAAAGGIAPDPGQLQADKQGVDAALAAADATKATTTQRQVIAREYVKAAIPFMQAGNWAEADAQLNKARDANPDEPLVYINLAITQLKQSRSQEALRLLEMAFEKGFRDFSVLEADADLRGLTQASSYRDLVARYQPK